MNPSRPNDIPYPPPGMPPAGPIYAPPADDMGIKDYLEVLRRRKALFIQVFVLVMAVGIVVTLLSKPVYETRAKLLVPVASSTVSLVDTKNPLSSILAQYQPDSVATQLQVLQADPFQEEARKNAGVQERPGIEPPTVRVSNVKDTNIIEITVEGGDPKEIARLANAMVDLHQKQTDVWANSGLTRTLELTRKGVQEARAKLDAANQKLLAFRRTHRVVQLTAEQESQAKEYVELQAKVRETQSNITTTRAQIQEIRSRLAKEPVDLVEDSTKENPRIEKLQAKLDELQLQRDDLLREFQPTSREVRDIDAQIASVQERLQAEPKELTTRRHTPNPVRPTLQMKLAELEAALQGHEADYNAAKALFETKAGVVDQLGPWEVEQSRLNAERDAALAAYTQLSEAQRDLELRRSARMPGAREIEKAPVPGSPVRPRKAVNLALTLFLALALASALAFLQEYLDDRINSPDDMERITALPTLGHVPLVSPDQPRLVSEMPANSHVAESYRALRSSIGFAGIDSPIRRLQITSASKGEGKSMTSINVATAMAMDGKRVILVDADMRRPSTHRVLNLPNSPGLSEVLVGTKTVEEAIQPTGIENLSLMPAGPIPPNPAELLGSRRFDQVIQELEERCDVVVFDTPPCIPVTDPLIIAGRMDGVVLVLHQGQTKKGAIRHVEEQLARARARIVGVIFNRVQHSKGGGYYYYHHYYYYGDGYYADQANRGERQRRNGRSPKLTAASSRETSDLTPRYSPEDDA